MDDVLSTVVSGIFIAAVTSWITVQLSFRKFRSEKWWERKADVYANVIEALHHSKEFSDQHLDAEVHGRELSGEKDAELRAKSKVAYAEIRRVASIGAFFLSDDAVLRLDRLHKEQKEASKAGSWPEYLIADLEVTSTCLDDMIKLAKTDLKV